jgi:U2 small nuclear ribonucleoprotein A'
MPLYLFYRRIADDLHETIPNIESLILTGNNLQELGDIDPLAKMPKLTVLSLLTNPVASKKYYREYLIYK